MPFNRRIYQNQGLFVAPTGTGTVSQISRVQSINDGWELNRQNILQQGRLAPLSREVVDAPTVNLSTTYYVTDGADEAKLGFYTGTASGCLVNIINRTQAEKNYFIPTVAEGSDLVGLSGNSVVDTRGIGNAFVSSYSVEGAVGGFLTANVSIEASNANYSLGGNAIPNPSINPSNGQALAGTYNIPTGITGSVGQPTVLKQGDLTVDFGISNPLGATLTGLGGAHIQSFNLNIPLSREQLQKLGNRYAYDRPITFPLDATLSVSAFANDLTTGNLSSLFCGSNTYSIDIRANSACANNANEIVYSVRGATLDSENFSSSIGGNTTVDMSFTISIGAPNDTVNNIYISGSA